MRGYRLLCGVIVLTLLTVLIPVASAAPPEDKEPGGNSGQHRNDNIKPNPKAEKQYKLRQKGLELKAQGKATGNVVEVAKGQFVELELERNDRVFVILAEFGDQIHPTTQGTPGPLHNQIPEPDRTVDNTSVWRSDFSRDYYSDLYFSSAEGANSVVNYYREQSSGRYTINGDVIDWVKVPFNEARYGTNLCGSNVCSTVWDLVNHSIDIWTANQIAAGKTAAEVKAELDTFDVWDRYDHDGDGNFDEPDGYIDHFQIVHAGTGEETGGGAQGPDAIWSHRWYAFYNLDGSVGPEFNMAGGSQFGDTGMWVGDYTIQPEDGGLGVFVHEYAHDLGLPDEYDTSGTGESSSAFWTLMASGSYLNDGLAETGLGMQPGHLNAWDKFQLGWLNYEVATSGKNSSHKLGPAETNTKQAQALIVVLPEKEKLVNLGAPTGSFAWWSGMGNLIDHTLTRSVTLPGDASALTFDAWYDIETNWDYAYVSVSTDNGASWVNLAGNITTATNPNGQNFGNGITGNSGGWVPATFDVSGYAGQSVQLRMRYWTDPFVIEPGFEFDNLHVTTSGDPVAIDDAESGDNGWTANGFTRTSGVESTFHFNAYIAEFRQYRGYDAGLQTGAYNFGHLNTMPDWAERFPYQDGLLISYWDTSFTDNNVGEHPGGGLILPIDAHPEPLIRPDGQPWRTRIQVYDATFGLEKTDAITLHLNGVASTHPSLAAAKTFDDRKDYWFASDPDSGVILPKTGTLIQVINYSAQGNFMQVQVKQAK